MEANKNFAKWLSCGIQISGTFGLHHVQGISTVLIQGISTVFIEQLPTSHIFRKVCNMLALKYSRANHVDSKSDE
jgi:hypothetical protein